MNTRLGIRHSNGPVTDTLLRAHRKEGADGVDTIKWDRTPDSLRDGSIDALLVEDTQVTPEIRETIGTIPTICLYNGYPMPELDKWAKEHHTPYIGQENTTDIAAEVSRLTERPEITKLISNLRHDLNNPLNGIINYCQLMFDNYKIADTPMPKLPNTLNTWSDYEHNGISKDMNPKFRSIQEYRANFIQGIENSFGVVQRFIDTYRTNLTAGNIPEDKKQRIETFLSGIDETMPDFEKYLDLIKRATNGDHDQVRLEYLDIRKANSFLPTEVYSPEEATSQIVHVFYADDDQGARTRMADAIGGKQLPGTNHYVNLTTISDGQQLIAMVDTLPPGSIVITDGNMLTPGEKVLEAMSGLDALGERILYTSEPTRYGKVAEHHGATILDKKTGIDPVIAQIAAYVNQV